MRSLLCSRLTIIGLVVSLPGLSFASDHNQTKPPAVKQSVKMTPELKKDMADMYEKMAVCLRTDKSLDQCSHDAMKNCPVVEKTGHCPINEGMGPMMGKRGRPSKGSRGGMDMNNMKGSDSTEGEK